MSSVQEDTISGLFRATACVFKFGGDWAWSCSNAVYMVTQDTLMGSPCLAGAVILGRVVMKWTRVFPGRGGLEEEKRACHQG